jgi:hypothetical protein
MILSRPEVTGDAEPYACIHFKPSLSKQTELASCDDIHVPSDLDGPRGFAGIAVQLLNPCRNIDISESSTVTFCPNSGGLMLLFDVVDVNVNVDVDVDVNVNVNVSVNGNGNENIIEREELLVSYWMS